MKASTLKRIEAIERSIAEMNEMGAALGDLGKRYLLLHKNIRLCGGPWDEKITLNLRKSDWPKQYKYCQEKFGNRILGMDINWIFMDKSFKQIVIELREANYTDAQIAQLCNCTREHVEKLGNGKIKEPGFRIGKRLTKLHEALQ